MCMDIRLLFHQPSAVIIDINVLKTLPRRQFNAGMAEVIKYGIIENKSFFNWIENNIEKIKSNLHVNDEKF